MKTRAIIYSPSEQKVLALLTKDKLTSNLIAHQYYAPKRVPVNGKMIVSGHLRSIRDKAKRKRETFKVKSTQRRGPHPIEWWVE